MFDLRYHVASLTAVFVALVIGILVGVGLSGKGFVNDAERDNLTNQIADLQREVDDAQGSLDTAARVGDALRRFADETYPAVVPGRLKGKTVAILFVGPIDGGTSFAIRKGISDAGGVVVRTRSIRAPLETASVEEILGREPALRHVQGTAKLGDLGEGLAVELVEGEKTPLWEALGEALVLERKGRSTPPVDAVVIVRTADPQRGPTKAFLAGIYAGLARAGVPAVGVEPSDADTSALPVFALAGLSTVDSVETSSGRLALVLLLGGAAPGSYGLEAGAVNGILPPVTPLPPQG